MTVATQGVPRLVERDAERQRMQRTLGQAMSGRGALLVLEADAGLGKTALLEIARAEAAQRGMGVLSARAAELERDFALGVVRQLLEPVAMSASAARSEELFAGAAILAQPIVTGGWAPPPTTEDPALPLLHGLFWLVANLSRERPLLLSIDDAHWADESSLRFLLFLLPRLESLPVAVTVAVRPSVGERPAPTASLLADPLVDVVRPASLSAAGVAAVVAAVVGPPESSFVQACVAATGGNPFLVQELVGEISARGIEPVAANAGELETLTPDRLARRLEGTLAGLPQSAAALCRAVAVLDGDAQMRYAAWLSGLTDEEAVDAATRLMRAGVLVDERPLRFRHPIVRAAAYAALSEAERAAAHGRAVRLLAGEGATEAAAMHLLHAEPLADPGVVDLLARSAERATASGALDLAVRLLQRALEEPPPLERRTEILIALGRAETHLARLADAEVHLREALDLARHDSRTRADAAVALARAFLRAGSMDAGATLLEQERESLGDPEVQHELAVELEAEFATMAWWNIANAPPTDRLERYARLTGRTAAERKLLAAVSRVFSLSGRSAGECLPLARRALADARILGPHGLGVIAWQAALGVVASAEDEATGEAALHAALTEARELMAPLEFCFATATAAKLDLERGRLTSAEANARLASDISREHALDRTFTVAPLLVEVLVEQGRLAEAEDLLRTSALDGELPDGVRYDGLRLARGGLRLAQGRLGAAAADFTAVAELYAALGARAGYSRAQPLLAVALRTTDGARALSLAEEHLELANRWQTPGARGHALRALALVKGGEDAVALLRDAVDALAESPLRLEHARALVDLGAALRRKGLRREARDVLRQGGDLAHHCGAAALARSAVMELRATGARPRSIVRTGADALTPMERRVAELAKQGLTNPEIAQLLFVTIKNVEGHLSHAYSKLSISSRKELPSVLTASGAREDDP